MQTISKALPIPTTISSKLVAFVALLAIAAAAPLLSGHAQPISGPIVNATLFLAATYLSTEYAIMIGLFPSIIALSVGLLPVVLAPMIPFIMVSNIILILVYKALNKRSFFIGSFAAAITKFAFLFATSSIVTHLILKPQFAQKAALMMGVVQLLTAIVGAGLAYAAIFGISKLAKQK